MLRTFSTQNVSIPRVSGGEPHQVVDGVLNFFVNYDFFTVKTEDQTPMETMTASTDVKEGG